MSGPMSPGRRIGLVVLTAALLFIAFELALQVRSHLRYGQSVFNALRGETRYFEDPRTGLKLLRPGRVFPGELVEIRTNSLGLRSPEVSHRRVEGSLRIAVVGASTVMGEMTRTNDETFSALLAERLRKRFNGRVVEVVNAGISGYRLEDQLRMMEKIVLPLQPDLVIVYPGFNDFADYCSVAEPGARRASLPQIDAPGWLLSLEVLRRNTAFLRGAPSVKQDLRDPDSVDIAPYRARLENIITAARQSGVTLLLATNARAYGPDQPRDVQLRLSAQARHYNPCFDLDGLNRLYERHTAAILDAARRHDVPVLPLHDRIPRDERFFVDATHFTAEGERLAADTILRFLLTEDLLGPDNVVVAGHVSGS